MEDNYNKVVITHDSVCNGLPQDIQVNIYNWTDTITEIDLSNRDLINLDCEFSFPPNVSNLNLSHNKLEEVASSVLHLEHLKTLDLSFNNIEFFEDTPRFCHSLEQLNLSCNKLHCPPFWIWSETPRNLTKLNLSGNENICSSLINGYLEELLKYTTAVTEIDMSDCKLNKHLILLSTFRKAKIIRLGSSKYSFKKHNMIESVPFDGLDKCCDIEKLILANTNLYTLNNKIDIYEHLLEVNLMDNNINSLPNEFCNLVNLEVCILSFNRLLYLPDLMYKLRKLTTLLLNDNELCMMPECVYKLPVLHTLDLYNNNIHDTPECLLNLEAFDLAQNYVEEPTLLEYVMRKEKLRMKFKYSDRVDERKMEVIRLDSEHSPITTDDEEYYIQLFNRGDAQQDLEREDSRSSSPEDWDSDAYWIPLCVPRESIPRSSWLYFVKQKMAEGNFCPMDAHAVSVTEKVKYEKLCNPQEPHESDGQFSDFSDDDS